MKFVHAADLHIDSPLAGLSRYEGAPVERIRQATRRATENLVALCLEEQVDFLLLAGDLFDGDWKDYSTGLFFSNQLARLKRSDIPVFIVRGNHDAASQISRHLNLPDNTHVLSTEAPETLKIERLGVAVHGQSYARREELSDLARTYPEAASGYFNIGLLHTSVSGRPGHASYAPCSLDMLISKGYQYWALGHVHQREVLNEEPMVVFSGNLQARHIKETGPKGASLVTVDGGKILSCEHRALDVVRFSQVSVTAAELEDADSVCERVQAQLEAELNQADARTLVARVTVGGMTAAHVRLQQQPEHYEQQIRALASELEQLWVESVRFETRPRVTTLALARRGDAVGQVARSLLELRGDAQAQAELLAEFEDLAAKLPADVREGELGVRLDETACIEAALAEVERMIVVGLVEMDESAEMDVELDESAETHEPVGLAEGALSE